MTVPGNVFLIAYGRLNKAERRFHEEAVKATGKESPLVGFIGAASGDHRGYIESIESYFRDAFRAEVQPIYLSRDPMPKSDAEAIVARADILYFGGGDVSVLVRTVRAAGLESALRGRHEEGAVVIGVSAGAIGLCRYWIEWPDPPTPDAPFEGAMLLPALAIVPNLVCDVHDVEDDWGELRTLVALLETRDEKLTAYGIPGGGALVVDGNGRVRGMGRRKVVIAEP
ncbi:MAG: Type 1 glutamine amidotransferase-like domain-containing protein [Planctomycetes bacterium]|nr:Type 1 glutamine amidotransferase-like domain-containing protein [Planctomycetota bacterium]MBI3847085.1 Type 1 glutamine amidotransferase-like domain-containing protein [Planctomycetota bacterium]